MADFANDYLNPARESIRGQSKAYYDQASQINQAATDQYIADNAAMHEEAARRYQANMRQELQKLPQDYQFAYGKNEVQQRINERQLADRMSQMGLTDSGLNRTQQTAINLQRSNADAAVTQQKTAQQNALQQALMEQLAANEQQRVSFENQAKYELAQRNQSLADALFQNSENQAYSIASSMYSADQQRAAAEAQAQADAWRAQNEAALKQYELGLKYGTNGTDYNLVRQMASDIYGDGSKTSYTDAWNQAYNLLNESPAYNTALNSAKQIADSIWKESNAGMGPIQNANIEDKVREAVAQELGRYVSNGEISEAEADKIVSSLNLFSYFPGFYTK